VISYNVGELKRTHRSIEMYTNNRISITIPPYLKEKLEKKSKEYGCSQADILRTSFIRILEADK
jgi:hypothetical protein